VSASKAGGKTGTAAPMGFARGLKSFVGYLEGTDKSEHTIKNYRLDLLSFQEFYEGLNGAGSPPIPLHRVSPAHLDRFHEHLKALGLKTNTRRRKLLTVRRFLAFLVNRGKLPIELGAKIPTPHKIERVPLTVSSKDLLSTIRALPHESLIDERNRALLWTLAETGCQVSEVAQLRFDDWSAKWVQGKPTVSIRGKSPREIPVSRDLVDVIEALRSRSKSESIFLGFNKFGALGGAISPRGVELLVKHFAPALGNAELTPRTFRHSVVVQWFKEGCSREEIQRRLGLRTAYAFRSYEPILKTIHL
jgi:site-specific recombinase XerD